MRKDRIFLWLIDPIHLFRGGATAKGVVDAYEAREPGYSLAALNSHVESAKFPIARGAMEISFIKAIHAHAASHLTSATPGECKSVINQFGVLPMWNKEKSISKAGVMQFLDTWFTSRNGVPSCHHLTFKNGESTFTIEGYSFAKKSFLVRENNTLRHIPGPQLRVRIDAYLDNPMAALDITTKPEKSGEAIKKRTEIALTKITKQFNRSIRLANTPEEKVASIAKYIQMIDQLHPFTDCNIRTCYILLNKLLVDHGFTPTVLFNPNDLDMLSIDEIVQEVVVGMVNYKKLETSAEGEPVDLLLSGNRGDCYAKVGAYIYEEAYIPAEAIDKLIDSFGARVLRQFQHRMQNHRAPSGKQILQRLQKKELVSQHILHALDGARVALASELIDKQDTPKQGLSIKKVALTADADYIAAFILNLSDTSVLNQYMTIVDSIINDEGLDTAEVMETLLKITALAGMQQAICANNKDHTSGISTHQLSQLMGEYRALAFSGDKKQQGRAADAEQRFMQAMKRKMKNQYLQTSALLRTAVQQSLMPGGGGLPSLR